MSNPGTDTLDLTNAQITGADPGDFQITGLTSGCVGSPPRSPPAQLRVQITFTPGGAGPRHATLTVTDNASPPTQSVTLTGVGAQTAAAVSPDNIDFGTVPVGNSGTVHAVTITSTGTAGLMSPGTPSAAPTRPTSTSSGEAAPSAFHPRGGQVLHRRRVLRADRRGFPKRHPDRQRRRRDSPQQVLLGGNGSPSADVAVFIMPSCPKVRPDRPSPTAWSPTISARPRPPR